MVNFKMVLWLRGNRKLRLREVQYSPRVTQQQGQSWNLIKQSTQDQHLPRSSRQRFLAAGCKSPIIIHQSTAAVFKGGKKGGKVLRLLPWLFSIFWSSVSGCGRPRVGSQTSPVIPQSPIPNRILNLETVQTSDPLGCIRFIRRPGVGPGRLT